jgi:hypothetical protein
MKDYYEIGSVPNSEDCCQVGQDGYDRFGREECRVYMNQIQRKHGPPPLGCSMHVASCPHDFGVYHEVHVRYDDDNEEHVKYVFGDEDKPGDMGCQMGCDTWDDKSRRELGDEYFEMVRLHNTR